VRRRGGAPPRVRAGAARPGLLLEPQAGEEGIEDLRHEGGDRRARPRGEAARAEGGLRDAQPVAGRHARDPEVDREAQVVAPPRRLLEAARGEAARAAELPGQRLLQGEAVGRAEEGPDDLGDERAVQGVARVDGRDEVGFAAERGTGEGHDRLRGHARDLGVEHDDGPRLEEIGGGEDGAERGRLSRHPVVGSTDPVARAQALGGDEGLPVDDRGVPDDVGGAVGRAAVDVHEGGALAGELPVEGDVDRAHDGPHAVGVVEGRQPDQDVHLADRHELGEQLVGEDRAHSQRSLNQKKS